MKIAVCLSGQPRSFEYVVPSILSYFSGSSYEVDYFCHVWNYNTWKLKTSTILWTGDELIETELLQSHINMLNPKVVLIEKRSDLPIDSGWNSLFYGIMISNNLKKQYEVCNNFRYDIVVRTRYDMIYPPNKKFSSNTIDDRMRLFVNHATRMPSEYNKINVSDVFFYGTSGVMDVVSDSYRHFSQKNTVYREDDSYLIGPGVMLGEYCTKYNIVVSQHDEIFPEVIYRKECIPRDPIQDYEFIFQNNFRYYTHD
jgi:hypothetical protein